MLDLDYMIEELKSQDHASWGRYYAILDLVEKNKLYKNEYPNFSTWLENFGTIYGKSTSFLWKIMKAGRYYTSFCEKNFNIGKYPDVIDLKIPVENLIIIEKICEDNWEITADLIDKSLTQQLTRNELSRMWSAEKSRRLEKGQLITRRTRYDRITLRREKNIIGNVYRYETDIMSVLVKSDWLFQCGLAAKNTSQGGVKYKLLKNNQTLLGHSYDAVIIENATASDDRLDIIAIEIKSFLPDYDLNQSDMNDFDFVYYVLPAEFEGAVNNNTSNGILIYDDGNLKLIKPAVRRKIVNREEMLSNILFGIL